MLALIHLTISCLPASERTFQAGFLSRVMP